MAHLHQLPLELLLSILCSVDLPKDLHSLISASPPCLHAFASNRSQILSSVLRNAIPPGALRDALAIWHVPSYSPLSESERCEKEQLERDRLEQGRRGLKQFLERYFSADPIEFPIDMPNLVALCRLQTLVSRFAHDLFLRSAHLLLSNDNLVQENGRSSDEVESRLFAPLSRTEQSRLYRAFFRYELYCRMFPRAPNSLRKSIFRGQDQFRLFLSRMEPWEVEEMSCVHNYFTSLVGKFVDNLEDQVVQAVLTLPGVSRVGNRPSSPDLPKRRRIGGMATHGGLVDDSFVPLRHDMPLSEADDGLPIDDGTKDGGNESSAGSSSGEELMPFDDLELVGLTLFDACRKREIPAFISNMASFGLEYMGQLVNGDSEKRKDMIQKEAPFSRDFLPEALRNSPLIDHPIVDPIVERPGHEKMSSSDQAPDENLSYYLLRRKGQLVYHQIYDRFRDLMYDPLRERGYVFWDITRIQAPNVYRNLEKSRDVSRHTVRCHSRRERRSVQERLQDVRLARSQMERVSREFGRDG